MKCPVCESEKLLPAKYESVSVLSCNGCNGHLVRSARLSAVKNSKAEIPAKIFDDLLQPNERDTLSRISCPSCLRGMDERKKRVIDHQFMINECDKCKYIWFDDGELQKFQVEYELSDQGEEMQRFRNRLENLTDKERADIDARIAKLGDPEFFDRDDYLMYCWIWGRML